MQSRQYPEPQSRVNEAHLLKVLAARLLQRIEHEMRQLRQSGQRTQLLTPLRYDI